MARATLLGCRLFWRGSNIKQLSLHDELKTLRKFFTLVHVNFFELAAAIPLAIFATGFQGLNYLLMVPVVHALISGNADFVRQAKYFKDLIAGLPSNISSSDTHLLFCLVSLIFMTTVIKIFAQGLFDVGGIRRAHKTTSKLRLLVYEKLLSHGKAFYDQRSLGALQYMIMNHPRVIAQGLNMLQRAFYSFIMLSVSFAIMMKISWRLTGATLVLWPLLNLSMKGVVRQIRQASVLGAKANNEFSKKISSALHCMPLIKACSFEETEKDRFIQPSEQLDRAAVAMARKQFLINPIQEIAGLIMIFVLIGLLAYNVIDKDTSHVAAAYLVFFIILRRATPLMNTLVRLRMSVAAMRGPLEDLENLFLNEEKFLIPQGTKKFEGVQKEIRFDRVSFEYPGRQPALKQVSFSMKKGQVTALVGPTGSGKTTLAHLLMRFYDCPPGTILVDEEDLRQFDLKSFHKKVAFISQELFLFNGTIRFNLNYGLEEPATEKDMNEALRQARLDLFVERLPQQMDTTLGDRGLRLSGGEKQRLSIARALLRKADILIFDEATSSLDSETEQLIQEAIRETVRGKTTLVVAHRFSTIRDAQHIVVLDKGSVVQTGTLEDLLKTSGVFSTLWKAQSFY